jgi:tetratricopeptide (TPR) repeat protein
MCMIKVKTIEIKEFRGIRELKLDLKSKNFAICGPNGTGKSGAVDALEFGLTGSISRLAGTGTGGISIKEHAPHVDSRNRPDRALVIIGVFIPSINMRATIERSVKDPNNPTVTPDDPAIHKILDQVAAHPEFELSRRELIRYVLSTPGDRSKEIQSLLHLQQVEDLRAVLVKITNAYKRDVAPAKRDVSDTTENLTRALEVGRLETGEVLEAVNKRRALLNLPPLSALTSNTSFKDGLTSLALSSQKIRVPKAQAAADLGKFKETLSALSSAENVTLYEALETELSEFAADPLALQGAARERFLKDALQFLDQEGCPVCDTPWDLDKLRAHISEKLKHFDEVSRRRKELEEKMVPVISSLQSLGTVIATLKQYNLLSATTPEIQALTDFDSASDKSRRALEAFLPIPAALKALGDIQAIPGNVPTAVKSIEAAIAAIPEPTQQDAARDFLTISQERLETYRTAQFRLKQVEDRAHLAEKVSDTYVAVSNQVLEGIYKEVEKEFSDFYRFVNSDDESGFTAQLLPSAGKLGFDVDFYGRGLFPPGAYHSEGHQDGMGFCLYLALMKHILGASFTLAILDDVLMSVDSGHRREVCALLKNKFPNTQFILTTHDPIWLRHMKTEGLIAEGAFARFRQWDVDHGPTKWDQRDVWEEIREDVENDDVQSAAGLLRHFLEYIFSEVCHRLRAPVEYRGDAQFQLGDLMPSAIPAFRKLLKDGRLAADSWGQADKAKEISARESALSSALTKANYEQWQINAAIHFNSWVTLSKADFAPVVEAFQELVAQFQCPVPICATFFEVVPERGRMQTLKCGCGAVSINLEPKRIADNERIIPRK